MANGERTNSRRCRFCEGSGVSKEHIIARWIGRSLDRLLPPGTRANYRHYSENPDAGIGPQHKSAGGPAFFTRAFCRGCNGGWMSQLEDRVRPVFEPLIYGQTRSLSPDDQALLAFWAEKTMLAFHSVEDVSTHWASDDTYHDLYRLQSALPYSQVWLGANAHGEAAWQRSFQIDLRHHDGASGTFGSILTVGHALFVAVVLPGVEERLQLDFEFAHALREIWPGSGRSILWPPPVRAAAPNLTGLAQLIARGSNLKPRIAETT